MDYSEFIPEPIQEEIASRNLSPGLSRALWEAAKVEVRTRPEQTLRQILAPVRCLIVPVSVVDPDTAQLRTFLFYVDIWVRPGERTVVYVSDADKPLGSPGPSSGEGTTPLRPDFTDT